MNPAAIFATIVLFLIGASLASYAYHGKFWQMPNMYSRRHNVAMFFSTIAFLGSLITALFCKN